MLSLSTTGIKSCETIGESNRNNSDCDLCINLADGYDVFFGGPLSLCIPCAATRSIDADTVDRYNVSSAESRPSQQKLTPPLTVIRENARFDHGSLRGGSE
jgi:hypothetical protein